MKQHKWLELAHEKKGYIYPPALYWLCAQYACKEVGITDGVIATWHVNHEFSYLCTPGSFTRAAKIILERLETDKKFLTKIVSVNNEQIPVMLKAAQKLSGDLQNVNGEELYQSWDTWLKEFIRLMTYSAMGTLLEMEEPLLTNKLEKLLVDKTGKDSKDLGMHFQVLTTSTDRTVTGQEEIDLLKLRLKQITTNTPNRDIIKHTKKYSWIAFGYNGPGWNDDDTRQRLEELTDNVNEIKKIIAEKENSETSIKQEQERVERKLNLSEQEKYLFHILRTLGFWKFERKFRNQQAHEMMEEFIREIARRNHLTVIQAKMIVPNEMADVLIHNKVDSNVLNERIKESVVLFEGTKTSVLEGKELKDLSKAIHDSLAIDDTNVKELHGSTAYPGYAKGVVKQVDLPEEMSKLNKGDILISTSTSPQILPAMKRASAVVTDSGGITCHAAIVARELKIPTIIGTKIVTKVLKDGDLVEVDAGKGLIKILKKKEF